MDDEVKQELNIILSELPQENSRIDYKSEAHRKDELIGLTNDICAFLNSEQSYGKNKYIICGVRDDRTRKGINKSDMLDDHYFQDAIKNIYPIPKIETNTFFYKGDWYGYILICKDNNDRVYEIRNERIKKESDYCTLREMYDNNAFAPIAWIRVGSTKDKLKEEERRRIYESDRLKRNFTLENNVVYIRDDNSLSNMVMKTALLFGEWNENNSNDKEIIERFSKISYEKFVEQFRIIAKKEDDFIFKNGVWKIVNRDKHFQNYALEFYKEDFDRINSIIIEILREENQKLDLLPEQRNMGSIYNKQTKYSSELRNGVAETLTIVESLKNNFTNCKRDASNFAILAVREILENSDWYIWASLDQLLPFLAEAAPSEFLNQIKDYLSRDIEKKILVENELGIITYHYSTSIYWSLELIAWNTDYFVSACMCLFEFAKNDEKALEHIINIILPWYPNTYAPFSYRLSLMKRILEQDVSIGWRILKKLMPGETSFVTSTYKPKYIQVPDEKISVTKLEYYNQVDSYFNLMIEYCNSDNERLLDLIDLLDNVSKKNFDIICNYLMTSQVKKKGNRSRYILWDRLEKMAHRIKKYSGITDNNKKEMIEKINNVIKYLKPDDASYVISRLFKKNAWELFEDHKSYESMEKKLKQERKSAIKNIYSENGIGSILKLVDIVEDSYTLGMILSELKIPNNEERNILLYLDEKDQLSNFAKGYVYGKYNLRNKKYNINVLKELSIKSKVNFLLMLPYNMATFKNVEILLKGNYKKYWKQVDIRIINDEVSLNYSVVKLMEVGRYGRILWMYRISLYHNNNFEYDENVILTCLEQINDDFDQHDICEAIEELQKKNADKNRMFYIEWKFLPLLSYDDYRPMTMEKEIATNVNKYAEILKLAYRGHSEKQEDRNVDSNMSMNAHRLLYRWEYVPGTNKDGYIDGDILKLWYADMQKTCKKIDRLEVGLHCFGRVLFHSPKDVDGFWIDKSVAEILNDNEKIMEGYKEKAYNSVGAVTWDENGTPYLKKKDEYRQKAEEIEIAGYPNFATALREIAYHFELSAEHMQDTYSEF